MLNFKLTRLLFVIIVATMIVLDIYGLSISFYWYLLPVGLYLVNIIIGAYFIEYQFFVDAYNKGLPNGNKVALTFDDGPHGVNTVRVLDVLDKYNAKATFFCIGSQIEANKNILIEILARGHSLGNHSFNHQHTFPMYSTKTMVEEIEKTNSEITKHTGQVNKLFRPPFGVTNPRIARAAKQTGIKIIGWSIRSYDTVGHDVKKVVNRVNSKLKAGAIVLLHDDRENTPEILEGILQGMNNMGLKSVVIEDLDKDN